MKSGEVYFVDDDEMVRRAAEQSLTLAGLTVNCFASAKAVLAALKPDWPGVIVTDIRMPVTDGLMLMQQILEFDPQTPVILISGHAQIEIAVQGIREGGYDFLEKPYPADKLVEVVSRALDQRALVIENRRLREQLHRQIPQVKLLGESKVMQELNQTLAHIGKTDADVLVLGETGSGKELVAESLHHFSNRKAKQFVAINCGALPETLIENELFGHVRGAFTGADKDRMGKFEYADGGTFFLDEIESMPMSMQVKMLRVLQERKIQRVGSLQDIDLDLRIVAASKIDLLQASAKGEFREDLYYRLDVVKIKIPPLRERKEDIPMLFQHFYDQACKRMDKEGEFIDGSLIARLQEHDWPGNVRELQHAAERAAIGLSDPLADDFLNNSKQHQQLSQRMDAFEKMTIKQELQKHGGSITKTYNSLGVSRKTLYDKMKKHQLSKKDVEK